MTLAASLLACLFALMWWRARRWKIVAHGWRDAAEGWREVAEGWQTLALKEQENRQRWQDWATLWEACALAPLRPSTLSGKVQ